MNQRDSENSSLALEQQGFRNPGTVYHNLPAAHLIEHAIRNGEGSIAENGSFVVRTGKHTGRSPNDKFLIQEPSSEKHIWWGPVNKALKPEQFDRLHQRVLDYLEGKDLYVQDLLAGADPTYQLPIRVITEDAWHNLFARQLFIRPEPSQIADHQPQFTVLNAPTFQADPEVDGTNSGAFVLVHFGKRMILIGGTAYAGEIKKSIFTIMNYLLPLQDVLSVHASANLSDNGDSALFFGLSGTGKTTLSASPDRCLVGDDEHGWSDQGLFNLEGGCYAKCINLTEAAEPQIYRALRFGSVLENVVMDVESRKLDFFDDAVTENTRAAYPLEFVPGAVLPSTAGHPKHVIFLTCDAFGVLPPITRLTPQQAMYHFISGYTAKVAGTEAGITEPEATFSTCFGAPFMTLHPTVYANLLREKIAKHGTTCWLINTGWSGGPYGEGSRIKLNFTRAMVRAVLDGTLNEVEVKTDPVFQFGIPERCPDVPAEILAPRNTWKDHDAYDRRARELAAQFTANFNQYDNIPQDVLAAAPRTD